MAKNIPSWIRVRCIRFFAWCYEFLVWRVFGFYSRGLVTQAKYLYTQSPLFKYRWQEVSLEFAKESFKHDQNYFFSKAKEESLRIKFQIFVDGFFGRERQAYFE